MTLARLLACAAAAVLAFGCVGKPFNVKTVPTVPPEQVGAPSAAGPLAVRAAAVWDEDWLLDTFDANLILAGVVPVRVDIENTGGEPAPLRKLKVELEGGGARFKRLDAKKAAKAVKGYYAITVTNKAGEKQYFADFASNALDLSAPLAPGERRQGFLFFAFPKKAERRPGPVTLRFGPTTVGMAP